MSSSKSLFEDVKWALSNRKLGPFKMALKKARKMHKYAKTAFIKKEGAFCFFLVPTVLFYQKVAIEVLNLCFFYEI